MFGEAEILSSVGAKSLVAIEMAAKEFLINVIMKVVEHHLQILQDALIFIGIWKIEVHCHEIVEFWF